MKKYSILWLPLLTRDHWTRTLANVIGNLAILVMIMSLGILLYGFITDASALVGKIFVGFGMSTFALMALAAFFELCYTKLDEKWKKERVINFGRKLRGE